ncbi:MAG TPA: penicillin-binding protein 1A [Burkholderiales bacterium]|nr:penicillin-binding protein 1A [Burkholderiales bacterium]
MTEPGSAFSRFLRRNLPANPWQLGLIGLLGAFAAGVVLLALVALILTPTLPAIDDLSDRRLKVPMRVYTADGELIAEFGEEKRIPVTIEQIPDQLVHAILAAEDHSFFYHQGVDFLGIARATWANLRAQRSAQGASTITMQVARNYFLSPEKTYTRKLKEVLLAFKIERELTKKEILMLYINKIFLGHRAYGFAAAAQVYYGKSLSELTLAETAQLAGLPKAPSRDNPLTNPENALERRNYVLRQMQKLGTVTDTALQSALAAPLTAAKHALRYDVEAPYIAEMARQYTIGKYDDEAYGGGFHVYTTLNAKHQRAANRALRRGLLEYERRHGYRGPVEHVNIHGEPDRESLDESLKDYRATGELVPGVVLTVEEQSAGVYTQDGVTVTIDWAGLSWARPYIEENAVGAAPRRAADVLRVGDIVYLEPPENAEGGYWRLAQIPRVGGAFVALRPQDGAVLALIGGFDFAESNYNRATQAERQPGSSFKPFYYAAALEKGFTPATTVSGAPIVVEDTNLEEEWRPEDYSRQFHGPTRLRKALAQSLNLVSVRLLRAIGVGYAVDYLGRFGFDPQKLPRNLSLALGTASATPMQMTSAFAVYANGGYRIEPYFIARIEDTNHKVLEQTTPAVAGAAANPGARAAPQVLSPEINFLITSMMRDVIREGTGRAALELGRKDLAGKTGTTNEYRDAWFAGFNNDLMATAWLGFDQPRPLGRGETGGRAALPIWMDYMRTALDGVPEKPLLVPEGVVKALVNSETGEPTTADDPQAIEEYFLQGTETQSVSVGDTETPTPVRPPAPPEPMPDNVRQKIF